MSSRDKAVNRRARTLPAEYHSKLAHLDTTYSGTRHGEVGSCVARLKTLGGILEPVVGAFGEASAQISTAGVQNMWQPGCQALFLAGTFS